MSYVHKEWNDVLRAYIEFLDQHVVEFGEDFPEPEDSYWVERKRLSREAIDDK